VAYSFKWWFFFSFCFINTQRKSRLVLLALRLSVKEEDGEFGGVYMDESELRLVALLAT